MDLRQLGYFVSVVEAGGFSRASVELNLAQPTLSRQLSLLEAELGTRLLVRTGRGVETTEAGALLLSHARSMLETARRARSEIHDLSASPAGRITIGLPPRVALAVGAELVQLFRARFPRAVITLSEGLSLHLREWLIAGRLDFGLMFDPAPAPGLNYKVLAQDTMVLVAPSAAPRLPSRVGLAALAEYPMVLPSAPNAIRSVLDGALSSRSIALQVIAEVGAVQTVLALVDKGVGYTVLPQGAIRAQPSTAKFQTAGIGPPIIRNKLVLATPDARPATRLTRETSTMLQSLDYRPLGG